MGENKEKKELLKEIERLRGELAGFKKRTAALAESERICRMIVEHSSSAVTVFDRSGKLLYINETGASNMDKKPGELDGQTVFDMFPDSGRKHLDRFHGVLKSGSSAVFEDTLDLPAGRKWFRSKILPLSGLQVEAVQIISNEITKVRRAEKELKHRIELERMITAMSTNFVKIAGAQVDSEINRALKRIGQFVQVDRAYIFLMNPDGKTMNNTHEWCAPGIDSHINDFRDFPVSSAPWWMKKMRRHEAVCINDIEKLPAAASLEKKLFRKQKLKSVVSVPLVIGAYLYGFMGFDSVKASMEWSEDIITLLRIAGEVFTNALERQRVEKELRGRISELQKLADMAVERELEIVSLKEELKKKKR